MSNNFILFPIFTHFIIVALLLIFWRKTDLQKWVSIIGNAVVVAAAAYLLRLVWVQGTTVLQAGNWPAPFGISFVLDTFSATLVLLTAVVGLAVSVYGAASLFRPRLKYGFYIAYHFLLMGVSGSFLTGDAFNLYVWFEIMIISSFVLLSLGAEKKQLEATMKYFTLNFLASLIFLTGLGILYGITGTLNMADIAEKMRNLHHTSLKQASAVFFLIGFGAKAGLFPLYFWLPASYHTPPSAVSAIFGGLLTKVGVYAIIRMFSLVFAGVPLMSQLFLILGCCTIVAGALGAVTQKNTLRVFGYLIICHIGFMIGGFGLFDKMALTGVVFYLVHDIVVKTNVFMISGLVYKIKGSYLYRHLGGLYGTYPRISLLAALVFFTLGGVPPLSGFWGKLPLLQSAFGSRNFLYVVCLMGGSIATLLIIAKMWGEVFWKKNDTRHRDYERFIYFNEISMSKKVGYVAPIVFLLVISLLIGLGAPLVYDLSSRIANELMNPEIYYIKKVLK